MILFTSNFKLCVETVTIIPELLAATILFAQRFYFAPSLTMQNFNIVTQKHSDILFVG